MGKSLHSEIAEALNLHISRVSQLKARGMPITSVPDAIDWYRTNVKSKHAPTPFSGPDGPAGGGADAYKVSRVVAEAYDIAVARAKREHHEARMAEMKEAQMAASLVDRNAVERRVAEAAAHIRRGLEQVADKLAERLAAESQAEVCHALITAEIDQVLDELSKVRLA